jgi:hypothetical protein
MVSGCAQGIVYISMLPILITQNYSETMKY